MNHENDPLYVDNILDATQSSESLSAEVQRKLAEVDAQVDGKIGETNDIINNKAHEVLTGLEEAGIEEGKLLKDLLGAMVPTDDNPFGATMQGVVFKLQKDKAKAKNSGDKDAIGELADLADAVSSVATTRAVIEESESTEGNEDFLISYTNERIDELVTNEVARATLQAMTDSLK